MANVFTDVYQAVGWKGLLIGYIVFMVVTLIIAFIFFRKYVSALITDYVFDGAFSFIDEILGIGLIPGLDVGDYIGSWFAYKREKKEVGTWPPKKVNWPALIIAIEGSNFIILSFIPGMDYITNIIPMATIVRLFYGYRKKAAKKMAVVNEERAFAEEVGADTSIVDEKLKDLKGKEKEKDFVGMFGVAKDLEMDMQVINKEAVGRKAGVVKDEIIQMLAAANETGLSADVMADLQQGISEIQEVLGAASEKEDYKEAMTLIEQAENMRVELAGLIEQEYQKAA